MNNARPHHAEKDHPQGLLRAGTIPRPFLEGNGDLPWDQEAYTVRAGRTASECVRGVYEEDRDGVDPPRAGARKPASF